MTIDCGCLFHNRQAAYPVNMEDYRTARSLGARVRIARKARGFRTTKDLVAAMPGTSITEAGLENIEAGRKATLDVSQLLNIAMALQVPLVYLLAPMGRPGDRLDLANLGTAFDDMSVADFDAWMSGLNGVVDALTMEEQSSRLELNALREWHRLTREARRLAALIEIESASTDMPDEIRQGSRTRLSNTRSEAEQLRRYLNSAGWSLDAV